MHASYRLAEGDEPELFATYDEADECEFIKANAPAGAWEAWSSADDGAGILVKADALRNQARELLVSAARSRTCLLSQQAMCPCPPLPTRVLCIQRPPPPSTATHHRPL